jgi:predicted DNA-binding protein (MmcQ/YjbR family)
VSLFAREPFEALIGSLRAAEIVRQWGDASVGKIGGKMFAIYWPLAADGVGGIAFKCSDISFQMLPELSGVIPAPYLARAKWVRVTPGSDLSDADIRAYVKEAHRLIASRLPRKLQGELGVPEAAS